MAPPTPILGKILLKIADGPATVLAQTSFALGVFVITDRLAYISFLHSCPDNGSSRVQQVSLLVSHPEPLFTVSLPTWVQLGVFIHSPPALSQALLALGSNSHVNSAVYESTPPSSPAKRSSPSFVRTFTRSQYSVEETLENDRLFSAPFGTNVFCKILANSATSSV